MSTLPHYNLEDFIYVTRGDGNRSRRYKHWCLICNKDRGYAYKNKVLKEPLCHACKMQQPETLAKIAASSTGRYVSEETKKKKSEAMYKLYGSNPLNRKISRNLRARLNKAIKFEWKTGSAVQDLGCSIEQLRIYLESKWKPGMTWDNYGVKGWHIDHIVPLNKFDLTDKVQLGKACHYTNLQPLWVSDNLEKRKTDGTFRS